jgi:hypothetical protein
LSCYLVVAVTACTYCGADWADARLGQQGRHHGCDEVMQLLFVRADLLV